MDLSKQKIVSDELDRSPAEVMKKLEAIRNKILWVNNLIKQVWIFNF